MICPKCNTTHKNQMAVFSIEKNGRCPDCYKKYCEAVAKEAAKNEYEVEVRYSSTITVKAQDEDEAADLALERTSDEYHNFDTYVRKTKDGTPVPEEDDATTKGQQSL